MRCGAEEGLWDDVLIIITKAHHPKGLPQHHISCFSYNNQILSTTFCAE
jgi:hypothetical protein